MVNRNNVANMFYVIKNPTYKYIIWVTVCIPLGIRGNKEVCTCLALHFLTICACLRCRPIVSWNGLSTISCRIWKVEMYGYLKERKQAQHCTVHFDIKKKSKLLTLLWLNLTLHSCRTVLIVVIINISSPNNTETYAKRDWDFNGFPSTIAFVKIHSK